MAARHHPKAPAKSAAASAGQPRLGRFRYRLEFLHERGDQPSTMEGAIINVPVYGGIGAQKLELATTADEYRAAAKTFMQTC
jgi:hypothetical protein